MNLSCQPSILSPAGQLRPIHQLCDASGDRSETGSGATGAGFRAGLGRGRHRRAAGAGRSAIPFPACACFRPWRAEREPFPPTSTPCGSSCAARPGARSSICREKSPRCWATDFDRADAMETFTYAGGRDLTGYEDGTENPGPDKRVGVAVAGADSATPFSSFVAVQRWAHDLERFNAHSQDRRDNMIGRRIKDNMELPDAPASAHVKRTAQESFEPAAFMWRRSQPWANNRRAGAGIHRLWRLARSVRADDGAHGGSRRRGPGRPVHVLAAGQWRLLLVPADENRPP